MSKIYVPLLGWRCTKCGSSGQIEAEATADCLTKEQRLLDAHEQANELCAAQFGNSGIATERIHPMPE